MAKSGPCGHQGQQRKSNWVRFFLERQKNHHRSCEPPQCGHIKSVCFETVQHFKVTNCRFPSETTPQWQRVRTRKITFSERIGGGEHHCGSLATTINDHHHHHHHYGLRLQPNTRHRLRLRHQQQQHHHVQHYPPHRNATSPPIRRTSTTLFFFFFLLLLHIDNHCHQGWETQEKNVRVLFGRNE